MHRLKELNISRVLKSVWMKPGISRIEIAKELNLNKSTVSVIVAELMEQNILLSREEGQAGPQGGRKPVLLELNGHFGWVLGLEIQPETIRAVALSLSGDSLIEWEGPGLKDITLLAQRVEEVLEYIYALLSKDAGKLLGIGIGVPGIVNPLSSVIHDSQPFGIDQPFDCSDIANRLKVPCWLENDANAFAWGEMYTHRSDSWENFLTVLVEFETEGYLTPRKGNIAVGIGVVIDSNLHYGENFSAGELRSVFWKPGTGTQFSINAQETGAVLKDIGIRTRVFEELSANLALIINVLGLQAVYIGGDLEPFADEFTPILEQAIKANWTYQGQNSCKAHLASHGRFTVAHGSAGLGLHRLFALSDLSKSWSESSPIGFDFVSHLS